MFYVGFGQDSHAFVDEGDPKPLALGGVTYPGERGLKGNSDADVILHALFNALTQAVGGRSIGHYCDDLCLRDGITDSREYLKIPLAMIEEKGCVINNVGISIEGQRPRIEPRADAIKRSLAQLLHISEDQIGINATSGEGLTAFGRCEGLQAFAIVSLISRSGVSARRRARRPTYLRKRMSELTVHAYAKINLTLEILRRLPSGYHEIKSVMQQTALCDDITIRDASAGITIESANANVPFNEHNTVWKVAALLKARFGINRGVKFRMTKRIPIGGGMGGGSADAAAVLLGLNRFWQLGLSLDEMLDLGAKIGMDVPFCVLGGTALATGRGEFVQPLPPLPQFHVVIVNPGIPVSTPKAYESLDLQHLTFADKSAQVVDAIARDDRDAIIASLHNDFESVVFDQYPVIGEIKRTLLDAGMSGALLSGSGASVFGIAKTEAQALAAVDALKYDHPFVIATQTKSPAL